MTELLILIIEDEPATARNLAHMLESVDKTVKIAGTLGSVEEAVNRLRANTDFDLIFMDIRLADGMSFDIFKKVEILQPVIFITAYNEYAIQAFKNNGIDYILKPFDEQDVEMALIKFRKLTSFPGRQETNIKAELLFEQLNQLVKPYKKSFLVHYRDKLIPLETVKIAWFYIANEVVYACTKDDRQYVIEFTMEQLEQQTDPGIFFRANRQFIINRSAITEVNFYFNGRLSVKMNPGSSERILISKARVPEFKSWMNT